MKVAILGYGSQGKSAYEYWKKAGNDVTVHDSRSNIELPIGATAVLGEEYLKDLDKYDLIVRAAPIIHPREIVAANPDSPDILDKVTSNTNEFMRVCPSKNIIGVTGTKGKGTTSTLIARILEASGYRVHLGGNIGTPPLELLSNDIKPEDWVVLELANFQLIDLKTSPHIAVCLMVVPEHLDWHEDMEEYIAAKQQLFINQGEDDLAIYFAENENSESVASASLGTLIPYFAEPGAIVKNNKVVIGNSEICDVSEIALLGEHNWQNVCAAVTAVWQIKQDTSAIKSVVKSFSGLPHRIELVREIDGIKFYNDSFASGLSATYAALNAINGPKVVIIGGYERGINITELPNELNKHSDIKKVLIIGQSAQRVVQTLDDANYNNYEVIEDKTIEPIVKKALESAVSGDSIILSPGFASFDMFNNFEDRGNKFKQAVMNL